MNKEIIIVYQDCFTCGAKKNWGEKTLEAIMNAKATVRKVSFASAEGQAHCMKAIENGITAFPFVTDGKTYAFDVKSLLEAQSEAQTTNKTAKKTKKTKKGVKNGPASDI